MNTIFNLEEIPTVRSDVLRTPDGQFTTKRNKQQFDKLRTTIIMLITRHQYVSGAIRRLTEENLMLKEKLKEYENKN